MINIDSIFKSRNITLPTKIQLVKAMVFPVVMYGCEIWTVKKADHRRIDAFGLWCWRRLLSPLDWKEIQPVCPKGDQSWVFVGRTDVETETPIFWPSHAKSWLIGKDPDAGKDWRQEEKRTTGWDRWIASPTRWTWVCIDFGSLWWTGRPGVWWFMESQRVWHDWVTELNWTNWTRKWTKKHVFLVAKENKYQGVDPPKDVQTFYTLDLKFTLTEIFLQLRWAYLGLAENCKLSFATMKCMCAHLLQSCPTLWDPMDCNPPGSSVHRILQAWILEWVALSSARGSSPPSDRTLVSFISFIGRWVLYLQSPQMHHI